MKEARDAREGDVIGQLASLSLEDEERSEGIPIPIPTTSVLESGGEGGVVMDLRKRRPRYVVPMFVQEGKKSWTREAGSEQVLNTRELLESSEAIRGKAYFHVDENGVATTEEFAEPESGQCRKLICNREVLPALLYISSIAVVVLICVLDAEDATFEDVFSMAEVKVLRLLSHFELEVFM